MLNIVDLLTIDGRAPDTIRITDIGAMDIDAGEPWRRLVDRGAATLLGFEPQQEECSRCNAESGEGYRFLPEAIGDGRTRTFHRCRFAPTSSLYVPNIDLVDHFSGLSNLMEVVETIPMPTRRLDDIDEARSTDFLKLDVQGAELDIFEHAKETLKNVSLIQTEVSYLQLYKDQPLFADVDRFLREQGFILHTILSFGSRTLKPFSFTDRPYAGIKQTLWSDVVYTKPFDTSPYGQDPSVFLKRAILFHELYQSYDFAARALQDYGQVTGRNLVEAYCSMLSQREAA